MKYTGGCHCGAVRFEAEAEIKDLVACNCSICAKRGYLLTFIPANKFKLLSGEKHLKDYQFGKKTIHHRFCSECGVGSFGEGAMPDGTKMAAINTRCLDDFDFQNAPVQHFDGKSL